ncbi:MAG: 4Fe-4S binding protein [Muricomes sp.]
MQCIQCGYCVEVCPKKCLHMMASIHHLIQKK